MKQFFTLMSLLLLGFQAGAQQWTLSGTVQDARNNAPIVGVKVTVHEKTAQTDSDGHFQMRFDAGEPAQSITLSMDGFYEAEFELKPTGKDLDLGVIFMAASQKSEVSANEDRIPIVVLDNVELEGNNFDENVSGVLSASNDVFLEAAAFNLSAARFRIRGYDSENMETWFNGVPINELESGRIFWSQWGGLNDVMRNRDTDLGLTAGSFGFGGVSGLTTIDTRASEQRAQKKFSYYFGNRAYRHRLMGTYSTGMTRKGWAVSVSGSRRWAERGYLPGTFYDAWSYFLSVDRKIGKNHLLNLTAFGAPSKRGRPGSSTQEVYDLVDKTLEGEKSYFDFFDVKEGKYYNPNWGWQNGKVRNSRVANSHQPIVLLRHDWDISENSTLTTAASYQFGRFGNTRLDWFNAPDPRPDYYRNLPSYYALQGAEIAQKIEADILADPSVLQLNFDRMIAANQSNPYKFKDTPGQWSQYILEEQRFDSKEFNFSTNYEGILTDFLTFNMGMTYQFYNGHNFKTVHDLLGGDYYVNINKFYDPADPAEGLQFDLNNPDRVVREGDVFGYDYEPKTWKSGLWAQARFEFKKIDAFVSTTTSRTRIWRKGNFRNGFFPDNSFGDSEKRNFFNYGIKGGLTYKLSNQYYLYGNTSFRTRAPFARNVFVAPRTRHGFIPGLTSEKITSSEGGLIINAPWGKARATAYYTRFADQTDVTQFFVRGIVTDFGSYILTNVEKVHTGVELAAEIKINAALRLSGVAALGKYVFTDNPRGLFSIDSEDSFEDLGTIFVKNFRVPGTPQNAFSASVNYNGKFWFAEVTANYFQNFYIDFSPERRTQNAAYGLEENAPFYNEIVQQSKAPNGLTVDLFGGKSFKVGHRKFIYLTIGISNILNNRNIVSGGFEQLSFDRASWEQGGQ
ncbi:MAG: TonB-dependent receptor, partial [Bacteroidetes bacterium]